MIAVTGLRRIRGRGQLIAVARVRIGPVTIAGIRVPESGWPGGWRLVAMPQVPVRRRADGSGSGWMAVVELEPPAQELVRDAVLEALEAAP